MLARRGVLTHAGLRTPARSFGPVFDELIDAHAAALELAGNRVR
jgi:hypothetical protein